MTLAPPSTDSLLPYSREALALAEPFAGRKRWTRQDCEFLERLGKMPERYELIDGEVIEKVGGNIPHGFCVMRAILWLSGIFGGDFVLTQISIEVSDRDQILNRPEPDVLVLSKSVQEYGQTPPASDLRFIIEIADSTLGDDLTTKAALYARAQIPEYWVRDVTGRQLFVHRNPVEGNYTQISGFREEDSIATEASPEQYILIANLLPPVSSEAK